MTTKKKIIIGILIFILITISGFLPIVLVFGMPFALIYAIYRAITGKVDKGTDAKPNKKQLADILSAGMTSQW